MVLLLPVVVIGGYFCPRLGFIVLALITLFLILTSRRGRFYCGWRCPKGAFHENILARISFNREIPKVFKTNWLRWIIFVVMMGFMTIRLVMAWGDPVEVGAVFRMMWVISTLLAIGIGFYFKPRIWCAICPSGTLQGVFSNNTYLLTVDEALCIECRKCEKVCPISTYAGQYKQEQHVPSIFCLRCHRCVENCPKKALSFRDKLPGMAVNAAE